MDGRQQGDSSPRHCRSRPPGVYGVQGTPNAKNIPGGRLGAVSWRDNQGNFWLFGGGGLDAVENFGFLNDLWRCNPTTREWTWMSGSSTLPSYNGGQPGVYGQMFTLGSKNTPGGRSGAFGWTDPQGNLWLFGGAGFDAAGTNGNLNDLWEYNIAAGEWAWMGGSSTLGVSGSVAGIYGAPRSLTSGSYPGSRNFGVAWTDQNGNLWLFGGYGEDAVDQHGDLNDLWKFVPTTRQWAWMSGSSTIPGAWEGWPGVYGQLGTPSTANTPGGRDSSAGWVDTSGNLWLFGGNGFESTSGGSYTNGFLNDLWEFNPTTNEWAWMGGSDEFASSCASLFGPVCGGNGVYGKLGTPSAANMPGSRVSPAIWVDAAGNVWMMGGEGFDASSSYVSLLNDLWKFDPSMNEWTWMGGPSTVSGNGQPGVYGTLGTAAAGNTPGGRMAAVGWTAADGSLWLMAGDGPDANGAMGDLNDLWQYQAAAAAPTFSVPAGTYAAVQTVSLSDTTAGATIYYTTNGTAPTTGSSVYNGPITVSTSETIQAIAVADGGVPSPVATAAYAIDLTTPVFTLSVSPNSLTLNPGASGVATVTVKPLNGFNSAVSLACSGLPAGVTCSFSPSPTTPSGSAATSQLTIAASGSAQLRRRSSPWLPDSTFALATCLLALKRRKNWRLSAVLLVVALGAGLLSGCAQLELPSTPQTLTITVTGTSGVIEQTSWLTLTMN